MNTINGYRLVKHGDDSFMLRQPGTRNTITIDRQQLKRIVKRIWGLR